MLIINILRGQSRLQQKIRLPTKGSRSSNEPSGSSSWRGEGKTSGGRCSVSFSGILSKGKPTRKIFLNKKIIIKRQRFLKKRGN